MSGIILLTPLPTRAGELPRHGMPEAFVYLREVAPAIAQEIRYATADNFTGRPLPGYQAGECVLRREVAQALARVQANLTPQHLRLKVYDCYRPVRTVRAMWRWSQDATGRGEKRFYPNVPKSELFARGYIATHSRHSTGTAVDLTLVALDGAHASSAQSRAVIGASHVPCTAPAGQRAGDNSLDNSLDMGTGFDCLDAKSTTRSGAITREQRRARDTLRAAMSARGFRNYFREWWHYEYSEAAQLAYDFPIEKR
jgi:D-alanyl-D-alanine dipeptidase